MAIRVGLIAEDINFIHFLQPACRKLAGAVPIEFARAETTSGCRAVRLRQIVGDVIDHCDLLVVAADAKARGRPLTHRRKASGLSGFLAGDERLLFAVAEPCVEAWLLSDPASFGAGIGAGTGEPFNMPPEWPMPRSESQAKNVLGLVIHRGCGGALPQAGFEFAAEIVGRMPLERSRCASLAEWSRSFRRRLESLR